MKLWPILLLALIISACAGDRLQLPDFDEAERSDKEVTDPTDYPLICGVETWDEECWQAFDVYEDVAENNKKIAQLNADIARDGEQAYDYILSAAKQQQQIGIIREEMLERERKDHFFDNVKHLIIIGLGIAGVML